MSTWTNAARPVRLCAVLFTVMAVMTGCTISIQPWTKPAPPPPQTPPFPDMNPNMMMKNGQQNTPAKNEEATQLIKNLNEEQDLRKALQDQVVSLRKQLKDREDNLRLASFEMDESSKQIKRTREEFRQWQSEMDDLRERIRKLEEYRSSAKPLIEDIYRYLERDSEPKMFKYAAPQK
jgi:vacuolar-type H+-ATPase subunit I/STV1